jgi:hypothetical protein
MDGRVTSKPRTGFTGSYGDWRGMACASAMLLLAGRCVVGARGLRAREERKAAPSVQY